MNYTITHEGECLHGHGKYRVEVRGDGFVTIPPMHELHHILAWITEQENERVGNA